MNDDLLFPLDDIERWKRGALPQEWSAKRGSDLLGRYRVLSEEIERLRRISTPEDWERIDHQL